MARGRKPVLGSAPARPVQVRFGPEQLAALDAWAKQRGMLNRGGTPDRSTAIRSLVMAGLGPRETRRLVQHLSEEQARALDPAVEALSSRAMRDRAGNVVRWELDDCGGPALVAVIEFEAEGGEKPGVDRPPADSVASS
jgi:hypothetical protein